MDNLLYNTLNKYFNLLSNVGYNNYKSVYKILFIVFIEEFIRRDFYGYLTEEDYSSIDRAFYYIYGTDCLIPVPNYCKYNMNKLYLGSVTEMTYKLSKMQESIDTHQEAVNKRVDEFDDRCTTIENTKVVKANEDYIEVTDINISN